MLQEFMYSSLEENTTQIVRLESDNNSTQIVRLELCSRTELVIHDISLEMFLIARITT